MIDQIYVDSPTVLLDEIEKWQNEGAREGGGGEKGGEGGGVR